MGESLFSKRAPCQTSLGGVPGRTATRFLRDVTSGRLDPGLPMEQCLPSAEPHVQS